MPYHGLLHKYGSLLDLPTHTRPVSLLEGDTPLIPAPNLAREMGGGFELFIKFEGLNPTGSSKDRGMTAAVSEALGRGATTVICASTGNTAAVALSGAGPSLIAFTARRNDGHLREYGQHGGLGRGLRGTRRVEVHCADPAGQGGGGKIGGRAGVRGAGHSGGWIVR